LNRIIAAKVSSLNLVLTVVESNYVLNCGGITTFHKPCGYRRAFNICSFNSAQGSRGLSTIYNRDSMYLKNTTIVLRCKIKIIYQGCYSIIINPKHIWLLLCGNLDVVIDVFVTTSAAEVITDICRKEIPAVIVEHLSQP